VLSALSTVRRLRGAQNFFAHVHIRRSDDARPNHAPISDANEREANQKEGWAMTKPDDRRAREREEIAARVASFKATQEKFERERDEYFRKTLADASKPQRPSFWS
jgi:hypothetical protein